VVRRADILRTLPEMLGLSRLEAAAYVGISATTFDQLVAETLMPRPRLIRGRQVWDVDELRAAFKTLPHDSEGEPDTWAAFRAKHDSNG
jgi:predicted DNA-binding transcriptional regulator AlpA